MKDVMKCQIIATLMIGALTGINAGCLLEAYPIKSLVSWNVSSIKETFSPKQLNTHATCFCVWSTHAEHEKTWPLLLLSSNNQDNQIVFDPENSKEVSRLEMGPLVQLLSLSMQNQRWAAGLSKEGKELVLVDTKNPTDIRRLRIPVYYPLKRVAFYHRQSDGRLFLFGINALGSVLTQLEITEKMTQMVPLRSLDLKEDFLDKAYDLVCDDEFGRLYIIGEKGRLTCWDADPEATMKPVLSLQKAVAIDTSSAPDWRGENAYGHHWFLLKTEGQNQGAEKTLGTIAAIERSSLRVTLWARGLDDTNPSRTLTLVGCHNLIALETTPGLGLIGLDEEGRICFFDARDFTLPK